MKIHLANNQAIFFCPGCKDDHSVAVNGEKNASGASWGWNGSLDAPTFTPSVLIKTGHYCVGQTNGACWCTYNAEHQDDPAPFACSVCHSFVRDGKIEFLSDCTHKLAGQTVEIPDTLLVKEA